MNTSRRETRVSYLYFVTRIFREAWIPLMLTVVSFVGAIFGLFGSFNKAKETSRIPEEHLAQFLADRSKEMGEFKGQLAEVQKTLSGLTKIPEDAQVAGALAKLSEDVQQHSARLKALDDAIQASPEKALSLPLLRKDIDNERAAVALELASVRSEIARTYDFNKWFFGLIATMAVSMLGFAFSQVFKKKTKDESA